MPITISSQRFAHAHNASLPSRTPAQANASTAIINYAPSLLARLGGDGGDGSSGNSGGGGGGSYKDDGDAMLYTGVVGVAKLAGVCAGACARGLGGGAGDNFEPIP